MKELISKLIEDDIRITLYCDLHAHSRKYNVFMYGCENRKRSQKYLMEQVVALITAADKNCFLLVSYFL